MSFREAIEGYFKEKKAEGMFIVLDHTPRVLQDVGVPDFPVLISPQTVKKAIFPAGNTGDNYHGLGVNMMERLPDLISDPEIVMNSLSHPQDSVVIVTGERDKENRPVVAAMQVDRTARSNFLYVTSNVIASVYGRENFESFLKDNIAAQSLLAFKNKKDRLCLNRGLQLPDIRSADRMIIIRDRAQNVNGLQERISRLRTNKVKNPEAYEEMVLQGRREIERAVFSRTRTADAVVNIQEGGSSRMNNEVTLQGKLVDEVQLETSKNGKHFARGKLAIEQAHGEEVKTHTYPFTVFGAVAEQLADYKAGAQLEVAGQLNRDDYTTAEGERRTSFSIVGREVKRPQEVGSKNAIKLSGFVQSQAEDGSLELKTSQDGKTQFVNFGLAVKRDSFHREGEPKSKAQYDTFYLTAFGDAAKQIVSSYHKGDLAEFHGNVNMGKNGISPIATSGKMIREASVIQDAQADRAAENENVQSAKSERVHTN